ncbi:MAG TPA: NAD(P)-binding domain-containing protein, partial [Azonexus sp.]|nr:NAD(P)-binding domain-containing protein [Azonexus sp.]
MKVGFIGLGAMGRPMALHLQAAGHELHVWARRPASADGLPATVHPTPAVLGAACEVVFTVITSSADVEGVALGDNGLIHGMAPGSVLVDCSTIAPDVARRIAGQLAEKGIHMLDAPVSGGEQGAIAATLAIMAGGDAAVLERVRPLLEKL